MLPFHEYADLFPLIEGTELAELAADLKANGLRDKIDMWESCILDGRNRYRALLAAELTDDTAGWGNKLYFRRFVPEVDGDPLKYVLSKNLRRRQLNESQRAYVAAKIANLPPGRPSDKPANLPVKQAEAASLLNVSERSVRSAAAVRAEGTPELQRAVEQGHLPVSAAAQAVRLDASKQRQIAEDAEAGRSNVVRTVIKQEARAARERDLGERQLAKIEGKFGVIVEDYEWDHETWSDRGRDRAAENHYPVSRDAHTAAEIVERTKDRFECADDNCVCFCWATLPHAAIAMDVLRLRGFTYKSQYAWGKDKIGLGYWGREKHEIMLIGVKGHIDCPAPGTQWDSLVMAPRGEHSAKPEAFLEMIEQYFPTLPKIELNRRGPARPGWSAWGFDAQSVGAPIAPSIKHPAKVGLDYWADESFDVPAFLPQRERAA